MNKKIITIIVITISILTGCASSKSYIVSDTHLYNGNTEIGYFDTYEQDDIASSINESDFDSPIDAFLKVMYVSDYFVTDERKIVTDEDYTLEYIELNVEPTAATTIQGEKTETEWHYFIYDEEKYIIDITVFDKMDCTEELEGYLEEYMKKIGG